MTQAAELIKGLPPPGTMVTLSSAYNPPHLKGLIVNPDNAFQFDFLIDQGTNRLSELEQKQEFTQLAKYFLASLTIPDEDQWVNLSPNEHNRIIKDNFGSTEMGRDLLAQDYLLKQITASLMYPDSKLGEIFWDKVHTRALKEFGVSDVPVDTINKVWIIPDQAEIYESGNTAYIVKSHLKVMLEENYLALANQAIGSQRADGLDARAPATAQQANATSRAHLSDANALGSQVVREVILPELEKEINEGENFAQLRQVFSSMILATWYKRSLKQSLLAAVYADKGKVKGFDVAAQSSEDIYQQYLAALKKGVYNYIKEDFDETTQEMIPRKYFAGGIQNNIGQIVKTTVVSSAVMSKTFGPKIQRASFLFLKYSAGIALAAASFFAPTESLAQVENGEGTSPQIVQSDEGSGDQLKLSNLILEKQSLMVKEKELTAQLSPGEVPPLKWQTQLGFEFNKRNGLPNYQLSVRTEGPLTDAISAGVGLRTGHFTGDPQDRFGTIEKGDFAALDAWVKYYGPVTARVSFTGLKGSLASRSPEEFQNLPASLQWDTKINPAKGAQQDLTGGGLAIDVGSKAFRVLNDLEISSYAGAYVWALQSGYANKSTFYQGASANSGAYVGIIADYRLSQTTSLQAWVSHNYNISHAKDYSSVPSSFGLVPVANDYGVAYSAPNLSVQLKSSLRLINNETTAAVVVGPPTNNFRINYKILESHYDFLLSSKSASFEWNVQPLTDKSITFSLNVWAARKGSPVVPYFTTKGMALSLSVQNDILNLNLTKTRTSDGDTRKFDLASAEKQARKVGSNSFLPGVFMDYPQFRTQVLKSPSLYDQPTLFLARSVQIYVDSMNRSQNFNDLAGNLAQQINLSNMMPAERQRQILIFALLSDQQFARHYTGDNRTLYDQEKMFTDLRTIVSNSQRGRPSTNISVPQGAAQFVTALTTQTGQLTNTNLQSFPTGVAMPVDPQGNATNQPVSVFISPDGIAYGSAGNERWILYATGAKDWETSRRILGAMLGVPQYYWEVVKDGRNEGYGRTPEGNIVLRALFPSFPEDMAGATGDFYQRAAKNQATIIQIRGKIKAINEQIKTLTLESKKPVKKPAGVSLAPDPVGGIDMNSANLNLLIKKDPQGTALPFNQQDLTLFSGLEGLVPQLIDIQPIQVPNLSAGDVK